MKAIGIFLYFLLFCSDFFGFAQTTVGPNSAGTGTNLGTVAWTNPNRIVSSNDSYAQATNGVTGNLQASNFGFAIPANATITGVLVEVERRANPVNPVTSTGWVQRTMTNYTGSATATVTYGTTTHAYTLPNPAGANRMMVAVIGIENTDLVAPQNPAVTITGVTYNGIAMTLGTTNYIAGTPTGNRVAIYYLLESQLATLTAGTSYNLLVTKNFAGETAGGVITPNEYVEIVGLNTYNNVNQTAPIDVANNANSGLNAITATTSFTNSRDGDIMVAGTMNNSPGGTVTQAATYTENFENARSNVGNGGNVGAILEVQSKTLTAPAGTETVSATSTGAGRLVICGIAVRAARVFDNTVQLVQGGVALGNNYAISNTFPNAWSDADTYVSYGGLTDTWGLAWTPAQINATTFGVSVRADATNATAFVDHIRITVRYIIILDAEIKSFEVRKTFKTVESSLIFSTTDHENYEFSLEKSTNGFDFIPISKTVIEGNKNQLQQLNKTDNNLLQGISYYRYKIVQLNNQKTTYTILRAISYEDRVSTNLLFYPNPCKEILHLQLSSGIIQKVLLYDLLGRIVVEQNNVSEKKDFLLTLPLLPQGIYMIVAINADGIFKEKLLIE